MSLRRLKAVTKKELLHIVRDVRSLMLALLLPLIMLLQDMTDKYLGWPIPGEGQPTESN